MIVLFGIFGFFTVASAAAAADGATVRERTLASSILSTSSLMLFPCA
jgi:hypothetical protein